MKKKRFDRQGIPVNLRKMFSGVKSRVFLMLFLTFVVSNVVLAQSKTVTLNVKSEPLSDVLVYIKDATGVQIIFNENQLERVTCGPVSLKDVPVKEAIDAVLKGKGFFCEVLDGVYVIKREVKKDEDVKKLTITGRVVDVKNNPLPGVTVRIKGTALGVASDADGNYSVTLTAGKEVPVLVFSFVGMTSKDVVYAGKEVIDVTLEEEPSEIDEVVVTGIFKKAKESYTGSVSTVTAKDLQMYKGQNLLQTLKSADASLNFTVNNLAGSNPNTLPQINIRGNSSLPNLEEFNQTASNTVNTPLIIMDGFEISLSKLMDYNADEIESINILKDASATAIYGSRGSNGVIVVVTRQPEVGKLRVNAELGLDLEVPDLTSYDLLNAEEKLALEKEVGLYDSKNPELDLDYKRVYSQRLKQVLTGMTTDWIDKPIRTGVGSHYNLRLEGGSDQFRWSATTNYKNVQGAMKNSSRRTFNGSITLMYFNKDFVFKNYTSYGVVRANESNYGAFSDYVAQQPYNFPYDEHGNVRDYFEGFYGNKRGRGEFNPLYDAELNTVDKNGYEELTNNFSVEWNMLKGVTLRGQFGVTSTSTHSDKFLPANHSYFTVENREEYSTDEGFFRRGRYTYGTGKENGYSGNVTLSYSNVFDEKHQLYVGFDYSVSASRLSNYLFELEGFTNERMNFLGNARAYAQNGVPSGQKSVTRRVGFTGNVNYTYDGCYYVDFSARVDGSSSFGSDKKYAPFWSVGLGWNIYREKFMPESEVLDVLRLKASYGKTGSQQGSGSGAKTVYKYMSDNKYVNWTGATLAEWGNPKLTWQSTDELNVGVEFGLWNGCVRGEFEYYEKKTSNLLSDMDLPLSMGRPSYVANIGEVRNRGWEAALNVYLIRDSAREFNWLVGGQMVYDKNWISKLSEAVKESTAAALADEDVEIGVLYYEGRPQNAIYTVKSLGIDPSTGKEVFLDRDGNMTDEWKAGDRVFAGGKDPLCRGNFNSMITWKGLTFNMSFAYRWGGKVYNQTLLDRVEVTMNGLKTSNMDARVFRDRWMKPGDKTFFKGFSNEETKATSRFVMDDNVLELQSVSLQYRWVSEKLEKMLGVESVTFGVNMNDLFHWSSTRLERGTAYPFARNILGSVKILF